MPILGRYKHGVVQGGLFSPALPAERFSFDPETREIHRTVERKDASMPAVETVVGVWSDRRPPTDLRAAADQVFLRSTRRPDFSGAPAVRVADLFAGAGAMSLGVAEACRALGLGFESAGGFEIQPQVAEVFGANFGRDKARTIDLAQVLRSDLSEAATDAERRLVEEVGPIDVVVGGPPCQGHSNLNNRTRRRDPKNELYFLMARFAQLTRPKFLLVENVASVRRDVRDVVGRTHQALVDLGYDVVEGVVDLFAIGVAQMRRRHVLVARLADGEGRNGQQLPPVSELLLPYQTRPRDVMWAIGDLGNVIEPTFMDAAKVPDEVNQARIDYLFDRDLYDLPNDQRPACHRFGHTYKSVYGRMHPNRPAPTITSGFDTMGQGRFVHPTRRRTITAHEAARIQFIPDFFDFRPASRSRRVLTEVIGNAAPPKLSYVFTLELLR